MDRSRAFFSDSHRCTYEILLCASDYCYKHSSWQLALRHAEEAKTFCFKNDQAEGAARANWANILTKKVGALTELGSFKRADESCNVPK